MELGQVIFDSDKNDWKINSSIFDEMIIGKEQLLFLIYPKLSFTIYGGMIYNKIDRYVIDEQDNEIIYGLSIEDENSFIFSINELGEMKTKGYIRRDSKECAFKLYKSSHENLFTFGQSDICIKKNGDCLFKKQSYNVEFSEGKMVAKRIVVVQMKEFKHNHKIYSKWNENKEKLERLTKMNFHGVIFDSNVDDWKINTSYFNDKIVGRDNLVFIVEISDDLFGGAFVKKKIDCFNLNPVNNTTYTINNNNGCVFIINKN